MLTVRTIPILAALAANAFLAGAAHAQFGILPGGAGQGVRFSFAAVGQNAAMDRPGLYRFYDEATLRNHWRRYGLAGPFPGKIDWTNDQIVIIHLGRRNSGGYAVSVAGMEKKTDGTARVTALETTPPQGSVTTRALTSPYAVLAVDRMIPRFELAWRTAPLGGFAAVPPGSIVLSQSGAVTVVSPLRGPCGVWGGDYYSLCDAPQTGWIASDADLLQYSQFTLGDASGLRSTFDWSSERLFAVHLGPRRTAVAIEVVSFERKGDRAVLRLAEVPARGFRPRPGRSASPYLLTRVSREIRRVDVEWAKPGDGKPGDKDEKPGG